MVAEFNEALKESVAETSDEMMDKYFSGESFTYAEMIQAAPGRAGAVHVPVLFGSAINCIGSLMLMDYIVDLLPNPMEGNHHKATMQNGETEDFVVSPGGVPTAYVFKTISDQYGKYSMIKVLSGVITSDLPLVTPAPARRKSWDACTKCAARKPKRSRSSPAATLAPSAKWTR